MWRWLSPVVFDRLSPFYVPDSGNGSGGNETEGDDDDELDDPPAPTATGNAVTDQIIRDYFDRNRAWVRRQRRVLAKNRTRANAAEQALNAEREGRADKPVISKDEKTLFDTYRELGTPDEIKTKIGSGEAAANEVQNLRRGGILRDAAELAGFNLTVLQDRVGTQEVLIKEVEKDGQKTREAYIKPEGGQEIALSKYAEEHWSAYLPALTAAGNAEESTERGTSSQRQFPGQRASRQPVNNQTAMKQVAATYTRNVYKGPPRAGKG